MGDFAPLAVFGYNRAQRLAGLIESLRGCEGFDQSAITVFVDGPKREADRAAVEEVRSLVSGLHLPNLTWTFGEQNRGLRQSIYAGVSGICAAHQRVIVLEDDLVLSPSALLYFNRALDHYQHDDSIWSVAGYMYDTPVLRDLDRTLTLPFAHPWGWATWSRAWSKFELDNQPSPESLRSQAFRTSFDLNGLYPFSMLLENTIAGRANSWYIHWYYTIFQHGGRSIFPPRRVLDNFGLAAGTHGSSLNPHERLVKRPPLLDKVPEFADATHADYWALDAMKASWELRVQRAISRLGSLKRRLRSSR